MRILLFLLFLFPVAIFVQGQVTVSGTISDLKSGERLVGGSVYSSETRLGVSANSYGFYSIKLPKGSNLIQVSCWLSDFVGQNEFIERYGDKLYPNHFIES